MMPPAKGAFSTKSVLAPALAAASAAALPAQPPQTRTSVSMVREELPGVFAAVAINGAETATAAVWTNFRREC